MIYSGATRGGCWYPVAWLMLGTSLYVRTDGGFKPCRTAGVELEISQGLIRNESWNTRWPSGGGRCSITSGKNIPRDARGSVTYKDQQDDAFNRNIIGDPIS